MAAIIDYPKVVVDALEDFGDLLPNEPQRRHFAECLTGLFVAPRKNVSGINREFAQTTDQSCLNRFVTDADWDVQQLNQRRLDLLQRDPTLRHSEQGIIRDHLTSGVQSSVHERTVGLVVCPRLARKRFARPNGYTAECRSWTRADLAKYEELLCFVRFLDEFPIFPNLPNVSVDPAVGCPFRQATPAQYHREDVAKLLPADSLPFHILLAFMALGKLGN